MYTIYTVKEGDTVSSVAAAFEIPPKKIIIDNNLSEDFHLIPGEALILISPEVTYTIETGDTVDSIAAKNNIDAVTLLQNNPELSVNEPVPGDQAVINIGGDKNHSFVTLGYAYHFIDHDILNTALPYLTYIVSFGYGFDEDGEILVPDDDYLVGQAHKFGTKVLLSLSTITDSGAFDNPFLPNLLKDLVLQNFVIENIIDIIISKNAAGIDIDMEYIPPELKVNFVDFLVNTSNRLHERGLIMNVALAPKTSAEQKGILYEAHDYGAIGAAADMVLLMTYEWGYKYGPPMAVAPLPNVTAVLLYALTEIPPEKILLGIPNYGYDWGLPFITGKTKAETISNTEAVNRAVRVGTDIHYDAVSEAPLYYYTNVEDLQPYAHVVWFEDVRSVSEKMNLAEQTGILGIGYWNLMNLFNQNFLYLISEYNIQKFE